MPRRTYTADKSTQKAKSQGYNARSVFKLEEIDQKYHLVKNGQKILDLGASPGSFIQYCRRKNPSGIIIGCDLSEIPEFKGPKSNPFSITFQCDLLSPDDEFEDRLEKIWTKYILGENSSLHTEGTPLIKDQNIRFNSGLPRTPSFDLVLSDAMGKTTGMSFLDHEESIDLCSRALEICEKYLRFGGNFLCKFFMGERHKELTKACLRVFRDVKLAKPQISKRSPKEFFLVCFGKKT